MGLLYNPVLNYECIPLAAMATENGTAIESEVEAIGEVQAGVCKEPDL